MDLFNLSARISLDTREYEEGIESSTKKAGLFGDVLKANIASEAIIAGAKKLANVIYELGKASYSSYARFEQLSGGAQLMFGDAYDFVSQKAKNAYKTVQMSQNDYLQQVNGFATGLKSALDGNAIAAAELADRIVTAEADVVAATGNTQEAVQNAFNGIMKSNYTMLDNLQIGVTPTKEGFQELIDKVNEWNAENGSMTNYTIDNLADCQSALVDYIEMQGLAGYASAEAAGTIEGSTASMMAAWENLATGFADETADMETLVGNFVDSVNTAVNNIIPTVGRIVTGIGKASVESISYIRKTNETVDAVITTVEDLGIAFAALTAGFTVQKIVTGFGTAQVAVSLLTLEVGKANLAQAVLNGTLTIGQTVVAVLTGKLSLATLATAAMQKAQIGLNAAMSANPIGIVITALGLLGIAVYHSIKGFNNLADSMVVQAETSAQAEENLRILQERLAEFEGNPGTWGAQKKREYLAVKQAIKETEEQIVELQQAEAEAGYAAEETADSMEQSAEESAAAAAELLETWQDAYQSFYDNLYNAADVLTTVNEKTKITAEEAHGNLEKNTQFYSEMGSNLEYVRDAAEASGVNIGDMLQTLSEMSTSDAAGTIDAIRQGLESLDGNAEAQTAKLQEWADSFKDYSESVSGVATFFADATTGIQVVTDTISQASETIQVVGQSVTNAQSEVSQTVELNNAAIIENMSSFLDEWEQTIEDLDKSAEARSAAESTLKAMISGLDAQLPPLLSKLKSIGQQMTSTLQSGIGTVKMTVDFETNGTIPGHATGLDYVPYDNYLAYLHRGEAVLTASEAAAWRTGKESVSGSGTDSGGNTTVNQYISAVPQTPVEFAAITEAYFEQARWN